MRATSPIRSGNNVRIGADLAGWTGVTFVVPAHVEVDHTADAAVPATLLPAMRTGVPLEITAPISATLRRGAERISEILRTWDRAIHPGAEWYRAVPLHATERAEVDGASAVGGTAAFFTGGVDSFHTLVTRREDIDALVFVRLLDRDHNPMLPVHAELVTRLSRVASSFDLPLIVVDTDILPFGASAGVGWIDYHGAALATVAHLLSPMFSRWFVPATATYANLYPNGSHPLLDPCWSSDKVEIVHDGAWATRVEKIQLLADVPAAREHLQVCYEQLVAGYNCGRCEKCVRTGVGIRIAGVEGRFESVPAPSLRQVAGVQINGLGRTWDDYRRQLGRSGAGQRLRRAIDVAFARRRIRSIRSGWGGHA